MTAISEPLAFVQDIFSMAFSRSPSDMERERWTRFFAQGRSADEMLRILMRSPEYDKKHGVAAAFPPGHYYSPVVNPNEVTDYVARQRKLQAQDLAGINLDCDSILSFWTNNLATIQATDFPERADPSSRFHYHNGSFPVGDAVMLRTMLTHYRPRRIVEIGSGYTTACMLDTIESAGLAETTLTCIEPYADRLRGLLRTEDWQRVTLIEDVVQAVDTDLFSKLTENDILFIDSTHVVKTGSDVHFEFFSILPKIRPGVIIHFHDVPFPFEYPDEWIFSANHSWNEAYFLHAFLMYNDRFKIVMWNSLLARQERGTVLRDFPLFLTNPGSSIWLQTLPKKAV